MSSNSPLKIHSSTPAIEIERLCQQGLKNLLARKELGFTQLPLRDSLWQQSQKLGSEWKSKFQQVVLMGIGGSSLGPQTIEDIFGRGQLLILDNVDPLLLKKIENQIDGSASGWSGTGFILTSKSGTTLETAAVASYISQKLTEKNLSVKDHVIVITEPKKNPLRVWAEANGCETLEVPLDVGGRFSVLSPVGMMPAAYLGLDLTEFRKGAEIALADSENTVKMAALAMESFGRQEWLTVCFFYSSLFRTFGGWWQQLWAESLAKRVDHNGIPAPRVSTPLSAVGACDQHSLLQQMMEGAKDKWIIFTRIASLSNQGPSISKPLFKEVDFIQGHRLGKILNVEAEATRSGLAQAGVSVTELELSEISPRSLGYLFMHWQLVVGSLGEVLKIDAFSQPGVELAKRLARENLVHP